MFVLFYGVEGADAEYSKFSIFKIHVFFSLCFTLSLAHGHLPPTMYVTTIISIVKNEAVILSDSNSYSPIELATTRSKIFGSICNLSVQNIYRLLTINLISHHYIVLIYVFIPWKSLLVVTKQ